MQATQQTIDKFRKTILDNTSEEHKAEILELKWGCKMEHKEHDMPWNKIVKLLVYNEKNGKFYCQDNDKSVFFKRIKLEDFDKHFEIIGRDLTLEDVLMALNESNDWVKNGFIGIDSNGWFQSTLPDRTDYINVKWNLTKPAQEQSEETLLAITELLK